MTRPGFRLSLLFNRQWWWTTLLIIAGIFLLARLGVWQLERLEQRRAANTVIQAQLAAPPLDLNREPPPDTASAARYRQVTAVGSYDIARQVFVVQQRYNERLGQYVITPLQIAGSDQVILVNRGWIPGSDDGLAAWPDFPVTGTVTVTGYIRATETLPDRLQTVPLTSSAPQEEWFRVDVAGIAAQLPYPLLPFYIQQTPETATPPANDILPYRIPLEIDLSDGSHLGYAVQWFIFSLTLGLGYIYYIHKQNRL